MVRKESKQSFFFIPNRDMSGDISVMTSYYQEWEINKHWLPPTIKQKLEIERLTKKDVDQIYFEESCSLFCGGDKILGSNLGIRVSGEIQNAAPAKQSCRRNCNTS